MAGLLNVFDPETAATVSDETEALRLVMQVHNSSIILSRARFTEDCLEGYISRGLTQYVILGLEWIRSLCAGRTCRQLEIFEVDHPATQANKRNAC
jgi:O-methyltransferase involved in polyketide biosynthesis